MRRRMNEVFYYARHTEQTNLNHVVNGRVAGANACANGGANNARVTCANNAGANNAGANNARVAGANNAVNQIVQSRAGSRFHRRLRPRRLPVLKSAAAAKASAAAAMAAANNAAAAPPKNAMVIRDMCVICQEPLKNYNFIVLSCKHRFCASCIIHNLRYTRKCPLCRAEIVKNRFDSLDITVSRLIVSDQIREQSFLQLMKRLHEVFKKSTPLLADNTMEFNRECITELTDILGTFGMDLCEYINLIYDK